MFSSIDTVWVLFGAVLVFFMQAGFAMVEAGMTRAKNAGNIVMKNLMDFAIGSVAYWLVGFGIMFGVSTAGGFIGGTEGIFLGQSMASIPGQIPPMAFFIFQTVFCATAATIVSGAMAERTKFSAYCIYSLVISLVIYPISGHWIWGGGWLSQMGFHDFAGSTAVHMVGGVAALVGAAILGPRLGKYGKDGKPKAILGHNLTLAALGVFILWFSWFGFNGASTLGMEGQESLVGTIFVNTNISAAVAAIAVMMITWVRYKKPDVSMTLNGALAGLVGITAGCDAVSPVGAALIGLISGTAVVFAVEFIDQKLKVDDPVGAISVHGVCGTLGTLCVGLFSTKEGLFYTGNASFLGIQALGVLSVAAWVAGTMVITFLLIKKTMGLRVTSQEEVEGLDIHEHGLQTSYADFMPMVTPEGAVIDTFAMQNQAATEKTIPVEYHSVKHEEEGTAGKKLTKVVIIMNSARFEELKNALNNIGVTGMTVTNVMGCGIQKGSTEYYRGAVIDMNLLPKMKVEIVVSKVPVQDVVDAAKRILHTGNIGDGKIFVYDIENVIKIRTGEEGYNALQDDQ